MYSRVVLTLDGSEFSKCALSHAATIAGSLGVPLVLLQVIPYPAVMDAGMEADEEATARRSLEQIAHDLRGQGMRVEIKIPWGDVVRQIVEFIQADPNTLLVMSTHGRTGLSKLTMGSVTESVLRDAKKTTMLICRCPER